MRSLLVWGRTRRDQRWVFLLVWRSALSVPVELWTVGDLAAFLRKPKSWVYENYARCYPFYRVGREVRFDPDEIRAVLKTHFRVSEPTV